MNIEANQPLAVKARQGLTLTSAQVQTARGGGTRLPPGATAIPMPEGVQCLVLMWRDWELTRTTMTLAEAMRLKPDDVDFHWDTVNEFVSFQPQNGPRRRYDGRIPRVGDDTGEPLLRTIMLCVPRVADGRRLAAEPILCHLCGNPLCQRAKEIRKALGESGRQPYFILTSRGGYRWNPERSWRLIQLLPAASNRAG